MIGVAYQYPASLIGNPLRYALALWRAIRDPANASEMKMVEIGLARSRVGRRFARWHEVADAMRADSGRWLIGDVW
jgi:hypothetical protein